jgi:hypothetical protein
VNAHPARASSVIALLALAACSEPAADVAHPRSFDEGGLAFSYPGNWKVTSSSEGPVRRLEVESTGFAMMEILEARPAIDMEPAKYGKIMMDAMQKVVAAKAHGAMEFKPSSTTPTTHAFLGAPRDGLRYRFEISNAGQAIAYTTDALSAKLADRSVFVWSQVSDDDGAKARPGFEQVVDSMHVTTKP